MPSTEDQLRFLGTELEVVDDGEPRNGRWEDSQEVAAIRARVVPFGGSLESTDHGRRLVARLPLEEVLT